MATNPELHNKVIWIRLMAHLLSEVECSVVERLVNINRARPLTVNELAIVEDVHNHAVTASSSGKAAWIL